LNGIFRVGRVPQEPKSPLVKHWYVVGHDALQFLSTVAKRTIGNPRSPLMNIAIADITCFLSKRPQGVKATRFLQHGSTLSLPGAIRGHRQLVDSGLTSLTADKTR
jgi:hypothetical protein